MIPSLTRLFAGDQPLVYVSAIAGQQYATQWTAYRGEVAPGVHEFVLLLELDPAAAGAGGSLFRERSTLICDDSLRPVRYESQSRGGRLSMSFEDSTVTVELPDKSVQTIQTGGIQFLLEANMPGLTAMLVALALQTGASEDIPMFLVNQLLPALYSLTPMDRASTAGAWYSSNLREELLVDEYGVLLQARQPAQGIIVERAKPAPPVPTWNDLDLRTAKPAAYRRPRNASFQLKDVAIAGPVVPLTATLTIPAGKGPFPTVLFLSGSGRHDRHGISGEIDIGTHEVLDFLAESGFAGLRYDTRGAGSTALGSDYLTMGLQALIEDARACLEYLRTQPEIDTGRLGLIGHSQGCTIAMTLASDPHFDLAGIALLAPMGRSIDDILADQLSVTGKQRGLNDDQVRSQIRDLKDYVDLVRNGVEFDPRSVPGHLLLGARSVQWMRDLLAHQPADLVAQVRCPILVCQGEKDFQVSPQKDAEALVAAGRAAGKDISYSPFPGLDHLFKPVKGESTLAQYFDRKRRVSRALLSRLCEWFEEATRLP